MTVNANSDFDDGLTNIRLEVAVNLHADSIIDFLNDSLDRKTWWEFWAANPWKDEFGIPVLSTRPSKMEQTWVREYEVATRLVKQHVDEWIDSGRRDDGSEAPKERNFLRAKEAFLDACLYLQESPKVVVFPDLRREPAAFPTVRFRPYGVDEPNDASWENHSHSRWKMQRIMAIVLCSELRFRIARCRFAKCRRPYFLLDRQLRKDIYRHGLFCSPAHSRAATAAQRMKERRDNFGNRLIEWAAEEVSKKWTGHRAAWYEDTAFRKRLAERVNERIGRFPIRTRDHIKVNWVTKHRLEIQAKVDQVRHLERPEVATKSFL